MLSLCAALYACSAPLAGILSDRIGAKQCMACPRSASLAAPPPARRSPHRRRLRLSGAAAPSQLLGTSLLMLAYLLLGPSPLLTGGAAPTLAGRWALLVIALCLIGVGAALAFIPGLPDSASPRNRKCFESETEGELNRGLAAAQWSTA